MTNSDLIQIVVISRNTHETGTRTTYNAHCQGKVLLHFDLVMTRRLSSVIFCYIFDSVSMVTQ